MRKFAYKYVDAFEKWGVYSYQDDKKSCGLFWEYYDTEEKAKIVCAVLNNPEGFIK